MKTDGWWAKFALPPTSLASLTHFMQDGYYHHSRGKEHDRGRAVKEKDHFPYRFAHQSSLF